MGFQTVNSNKRGTRHCAPKSIYLRCHVRIWQTGSKSNGRRYIRNQNIIIENLCCFWFLIQYATSRKAAGSFPDEVIGFFNWPNHSSRTRVLGLTQSLTKMSTRNLAGCKGRPARETDNLTTICEPTLCKIWEPRRLTTPWASTASYRDGFTFLFTIIISSSSSFISKISSRFIFLIL
jgi:hypothetical protein